MYIIKNAFRCIARSKGRSVLIGIITLVIAISACLGLSIRQASENAKASALSGMSVTATISYDRGSMMGQIGGDNRGEGGRPSFDRDQFSEMMGKASSLTLEQYQTYATAESVKDFYYTLSVSFNGSEDFEPVTDEEEDDSSSNQQNGMMGGFPGGMMGGMSGGRFESSDFSILGYSSDASMTEFVNGTATILDGGTMFEQGTAEYTCVISEELALFNELAVGDTVIITNPSSEDDTYTLTICGIYSSSQTNDFSMSMFGAGQDPANRIYMSAAAVQAMVTASEAKAEDDAVKSTIEATYVFADAESYEAFDAEARALGLEDSYTISSTDLTAFESSLAPLNTLSTMAGWFLLVILIIGAIILVVLNIFNVRERKYEVGVLTAMGMKKWKVATQFICEILAVTMLAVVIGAGIGAVTSVPVTNMLLEGQVQSQTAQQSQMDNAFGRPGNIDFGNLPSGRPSGGPSGMPSKPGGGMFGGAFENMFNSATEYITEVDSAMNLTVVFQMLGVGLLLTLVAGAVSVLFIMRYDPLKILANRD